LPDLHGHDSSFGISINQYTKTAALVKIILKSLPDLHGHDLSLFVYQSINPPKQQQQLNSAYIS
jgi:hypothetical protein